MKKFTLAAIMLFATAIVFAQNEKTTVIIKGHQDGDEKVTVIEKFLKNKLCDPLPGIYYAYLDMRSGAFGPEASLPLRSSSFEWGLYSTKEVVCSKGGHFGISTGLGISNAYNYFTHDKVLNVDANRNAFIQSLREYSDQEGHGPGNDYAHRSFLRYWSLRLPVMIQCQWMVSDDPMALAVGAELEWRFGVRSFARYGGSKHTITDDLDYSPVGFNALVSLAFDEAVIFFRMGLTDMFKIKDANNELGDVNQMAIGFGFNFD